MSLTDVGVSPSGISSGVSWILINCLSLNAHLEGEKREGRRRGKGRKEGRKEGRGGEGRKEKRRKRKKSKINEMIGK